MSDITLAKSVIFQHLEDFLNDIIELKYVTIEVGMGVDDYSPDTDFQPIFMDRIIKLKEILVKRKILLENIRMHIPLGYRYDLYDNIWDNKNYKYYCSFDMIEMFILKAYYEGFRHFVMHAPSFCVEIVKNEKITVMDFDKLFDEYCYKLKKLKKKINGGLLGNIAQSKKGIIYMEFTNPKDFTYSKVGLTKKYVGTNMQLYKKILQKTGVQPLLDTGIFDSIDEFKIAKADLEKEGFKVKAIHLQQSVKTAHHNPLTPEQFKSVIENFTGIIIDEGLMNHPFKEGELGPLIRSGESLKYHLTKEEQIKILKEYLKILGPRAKLMFNSVSR